jgi:predicted amidohydrolase
MLRSASLLVWLAVATGAVAGGEPRHDIRVAQLAGEPVKWNLDANFAVFLERLAAADHADLFITPECWLDGYAAADPASSRDRLRTVAQDLHASPYLQRVAREARDRGLWICFGFTSLEGERIFNAAGLWNDRGELVGVYHKTHIQTHDAQYDPGEALSVYDSPWGPLGIVICADRRWPESMRTLRLQGARLILNPTYGFHGDLNTAVIRTRAYENQCFVGFTHPRESLITGPRGDVITQRVGTAGWTEVTTLDLSSADATRRSSNVTDRRPELYGRLAAGLSTTAARPVEGATLRVAVAQMASSFDVAANATRILEHLEAAAARNARIVVFPEMALTGYSKEAGFGATLDWVAVDRAMQELRTACARLGLYAVVGAPTRDGDRLFCAAVTIGPDGAILDAFEKIHRAGEAWASAGRRLGTFEIDGIRAGSFICHDERYGPLVQLRALAGTRLFFCISCESGPHELRKIGPYRAQIQARAVENGVFILHANTPASIHGVPGMAAASHGESRIVDPSGTILAEAPVYGDALLIADIVPDVARSAGLPAALAEGPLADWMRQGLGLVE